MLKNNEQALIKIILGLAKESRLSISNIDRECLDLSMKREDTQDLRELLSRLGFVKTPY